MKRRAKEDLDMADLLPQAEAARVLGITRAGVSWLVANGRLNTTEVWGRPFVSRSEVLAYMAQRKAGKGKAKK
jgi:hypothetical protein